MKKLLFVKIVFISITLLFASCASNNFGSRKYTAGKYHETRNKAPKVKAIEKNNDEAVYASSDNGINELDAKPQTSEPLVISQPKENTEEKQQSTETKLPKLAKINPIKNIKTEIEEFKKHKAESLDTDKKTESNASKGSSGVDKTALMSTILSVLAIVCNIIGFMIIISLTEYFAFVFFAAALALGIVGLIMGTKGLKKHRQNNGSVADLILSIVGTVLGGVSIIMAVYYSLWSLLWLFVTS